MNYVVVDIETTGKSELGEGITEIAAIKFCEDGSIEEFQTLLKPVQPITPFVQSLTGITNEMLIDAPTFYDIKDDLYEFLLGSVFIAHNVNFDLGFIQKAFLKYKVWYDPDHLCTVQSSRQILKGLRSYSLGKLCRSIGIELNNRHRAMGDARATLQLLKRLLEEKSNDLSQYLKVGGVTQDLPKGIHPNDLKSLMGKSGWLALVGYDGELLTAMVGGDLYTVWKNYCKRFKVKPKKWSAISTISFEFHSSKLMAEAVLNRVVIETPPIWQKKVLPLKKAEIDDGLYFERWGNSYTYLYIVDNLVLSYHKKEEEIEMSIEKFSRLVPAIEVSVKFSQSLNRNQLKWLQN